MTSSRTKTLYSAVSGARKCVRELKPTQVAEDQDLCLDHRM